MNCGMDVQPIGEAVTMERNWPSRAFWNHCEFRAIRGVKNLENHRTFDRNANVPGVSTKISNPQFQSLRALVANKSQTVRLEWAWTILL